VKNQASSMFPSQASMPMLARVRVQFNEWWVWLYMLLRIFCTKKTNTKVMDHALNHTIVYALWCAGNWESHVCVCVYFLIKGLPRKKTACSCKLPKKTRRSKTISMFILTCQSSLAPDARGWGFFFFLIWHLNYLLSTKMSILFKQF
jgi:hypothetical protein